MPHPEQKVKSKPYVIVDDFLPPTSADQLAIMMVSASDWRFHEEDFFSQNDTSFVRREPNGRTTGRLTDDILCLLRSGKLLIEQSFNAVIGSHFTVVGHKMLPGQVIRIHNDSPVGDRGRTENYRVIYYIDHHFSDEHGGHLLLFASRDADTLLDAVRPNFNSAVAMELSESSFHAVAPVRAGVRHSMVASYWGYPIHPFPKSAQARVAAVLRILIQKGYENVRHSGTTFLYHLYHTGEVLARLEQDEDVCLAGLCHSLMGREGVELGATSIQMAKLQGLVGPNATSLVRRMSLPINFRKISAGAAHEIVVQGIIEIANELEQAESDQELDELKDSISGARFLPVGLCDLMLREVERSKDALRSVVTPVFSSTSS